MNGKTSPDRKDRGFEFVDVAASTQYGHMHHAYVHAIDANHHSEEWTFMEGDSPSTHTLKFSGQNDEVKSLTRFENLMTVSE